MNLLTGGLSAISAANEGNEVTKQPILRNLYHKGSVSG